MFKGINEFGVSHLFATPDVIEDDNSIIIKIHGVDKNVNDSFAESRISRIAFADFPQPRTHFRLRDAHFLRDAKLRQIGFGVDLLNLDADLLVFSRYDGDDVYITVANNSEENITIFCDSPITELVYDKQGERIQLGANTVGIIKTKKDSYIYIN